MSIPITNLPGRRAIVTAYRASLNLTVNVKDRVTGNPIDLTGYVFEGQVEALGPGAGPAQDFAFEHTALGQFKIKLTAAQVIALGRTQRTYWVNGTRAGETEPFIAGAFTVQ